MAERAVEAVTALYDELSAREELGLEDVVTAGLDAARESGLYPGNEVDVPDRYADAVDTDTLQAALDGWYDRVGGDGTGELPFVDPVEPSRGEAPALGDGHYTF